MIRGLMFRRLRVVALALAAMLFAGALARAKASVCTLADHIRSANTDAAVGFCPAGTSHDVITLTADLTLAEALPAITGRITIEGGGHAISGAGQFRIFDVDGGQLTLRNLTLAEGKASKHENGGALRLGDGASATVENLSFRDNAAFNGGAVAVSGDARLVIRKSRFQRNTAGDFAGALFADGGDIVIERSSFEGNQAGYYGGAIAAHAGTMVISNSTFTGNRADFGGALEVFTAEVALTHVTMMDNESRHGDGDGIHRTAGIVKLRNSIVGGPLGCTGRLTEARGNLSQDGSCDLLGRESELMLGDLTGAPAWYPLLDGSPAIDAADPQFCLNADQLGRARPQGGGCDIGAIESLRGKPAPTAEATICTLRDQIVAANTDAPYRDCPAGRGADTILMIRDYVHDEPLPPIASDITIEGNGHTISGRSRHRIFDVAGGSLTLRNVTLERGFAVSGGAIRLREGARVNAEGVSFSYNRADNGGAISTLSADARATITESRFIGNRSDEYGGAIFAFRGAVTLENSSFSKNRAQAYGGALHAEYGSISASNSTFSRNWAWGGGALNVHSGAVRLTHVTLLDNEATGANGDAIINYGGTVRLYNSIIHSEGEAADCDGGLTQSRGSLSSDGTCAERASADPRLDKLIGAPAYHPLLDGSPAVDAALAEFCPARDQIGASRPIGGGCDIGAIESTSASPAPATPAPKVCDLHDQILAANSDRRSGHCPAGNGADTITLSADVALTSRLPQITSGLTIEGNGHAISGDGRFPIFTVRGAWLKINNLTMTEGSDPRGNGGALKMLDDTSVVVNRSRFVNNRAESGGAIFMFGRNSRLVVYDSSFRDNASEYLGGAIEMRAGELIVSGSSFTGNRSGSGAAIHVNSGDKVTVSNSSFSGNVAERLGGAVAAYFPQTTLTHVTMLNNEAEEGGGVWAAEGRHTSNLRLRNSVIAGGIGGDCVGPLTQNIGNLIEDGSCSPRFGGDPLFGEETGFPAWHPLLAGSPAIDGADARFCPAKDQAGAPRPQGGGCDIGAIESSLAKAEEALSRQALADCRVTTTHVLNFRDGPRGNRIGSVPRAATLAAVARTAGWFNVEHRGASGWISADYVVAQGDCG